MQQWEVYKLFDFTKSKKIGKGGFGTAFIARRKWDGMEICVEKIPLNEEVCEEEIERKVKMHSELNDEHIINYFWSFLESGNIYMAIEYAAEGSLGDMIDICYLWNTIYVAADLFVRSANA